MGEPCTTRDAAFAPWGGGWISIRNRFSSALAAVFVMGCTADTEATADGETALGDDELNAVNNKMGLRLTYDDPSGHRTRDHGGKAPRRREARDARPTPPARGRRATVLDCSQLAEAVPLSASAIKPMYVGPELDRSMLACVYTQQWVDQNIPPDVVQELSVDGAYSIVDACIVRQEAVRARLQTSLEYAWDANDPHIDPAFVHSR